MAVDCIHLFVLVCYSVTLLCLYFKSMYVSIWIMYMLECVLMCDVHLCVTVCDFVLFFLTVIDGL